MKAKTIDGRETMMSRAANITSDIETASVDAGEGILATILETSPIEASEAFLILRQIATAVDEMHTAGSFHGALNPWSVRIVNDRSASILSPTRDRNETPHAPDAEAAQYLSPECLSTSDAGTAADQFSLGVIAYRMLLGRSPFTGAGLAETLFLIRYGILDQGAHAYIDFAMQGVFDRVFSVQPEHRFASCLEFVEALERIPRRTYSETRLLENEEELSLILPDPPTQSGQREPRRAGSVWWWAAAPLSLLAFALGLANWYAHREIGRISEQTAMAMRNQENAGLHNGKLAVCNTSPDPIHIREAAAAYMNSASHLTVFNSTEHTHDGWVIASARSETLSWRPGSDAGWDGSVLFYFLRVVRGEKEYVIAGRWNGASEGCLHLGS
jgi:hypothetical protein